MAAKETLTGLWHGLYSYPRYAEPVYFVTTMIQSGGHLSGLIHEAVTGRSGTPLTVYASFAGEKRASEISFRKLYDGSGGWVHAVLYAGTLSPDTLEIEGEWTIPGEWSGRFLMIRSGGASETVVRKVYAKA